MSAATFERVNLAVMRVGLCLVLLLPLYVAAGLLYPFITGRAFAFRMVIEVLLVAWVGLLALSPRYRPALSPLTWAVLVLLLIVTVADVLGANPFHSVWSNYERMDGLAAIAHAALYFLMLKSVVRGTTEWRVYLSTSGAVSVIVALIALYQKVTTPIEPRVDGTFGNPNYLAVYLMFHVLFLLFLLWGERRAWLRGLLAVVVTVEACVIYFTATRAVVLALLCAAAFMAVVWALRRPADARERLARRLAVATLALGLTAVALVIAARGSAVVQGSLLLSRSFDAQTATARLLVWDTAWRGVRDRPWLGWGQENFYITFSAYYPSGLYIHDPAWFDRTHNVILDWLVHAGVLGLAAYLAVLALAARNFGLAFRRGRLAFYEASILEALLVAYVVQNLFLFDSLSTYVLLFATLALSDALAAPEPEAGDVSTEVSEEWRRRVAVAMIAAGVVAVGGLYLLNARPLMAARDLGRAADRWAAKAPLGAVLGHFDDAIARGAFARSDTAALMADLLPHVLGTAPAHRPDVAAFTRRTIAELERLAQGPAVNVRNLFRLAGVYRRAVVLDASYARLAVDTSTRAVALSPTDPRLRSELASAHVAAGNFGDAAAAMEAVVRLVPTHAPSQLRLAEFAMRAGSREVGEAAIERFRALVARPEPNDLRRVARAYAAGGDRRRARGLVEEITRGANPAAVEQYYAGLLAEAGDKDGAREAARRAVELDPRLKASAEQFIQDSMW